MIRSCPCSVPPISILMMMPLLATHNQLRGSTAVSPLVVLYFVGSRPTSGDYLITDAMLCFNRFQFRTLFVDMMSATCSCTLSMLPQNLSESCGTRNSSEANRNVYSSRTIMYEMNLSIYIFCRKIMYFLSQ